MILEATRKTQPTLINDATHLDLWETIALLIVALLDATAWLRFHWPKAQVYALSRYDLARRHLDSFPPAHWSLGWAFMASLIFFLWLQLVYNGAQYLLEKGMGIC